MLQKRLLNVLIPCVALGVSTSVSAHTIQEAVAHAIKTGPDMLISANSREAVEEELRGAFAGYLPTIDLNAGYGREWSYNATTRAFQATYTAATAPGVVVSPNLSLWREELGVTARQMLFDGFATRSNVQGQLARVHAASWRANSQAQEIALEVIRAFLDVRLKERLAEYARINKDAHQRIFSKIQKRSEGGVARKADLDQAQGRLAFSNANYLAAQSNLRDAQTKYLRLVGLPPNSLEAASLPQGGFPESLEAAIIEGIHNNPELKAATTDVAVTRAAKKLSEAAFYPRVDLELGANNNYNIDGSIGTGPAPGPGVLLPGAINGSNDDKYAMIRARWNIFNGGKDIAKGKENSWKIEEAKEVRNRAHRETEEAVRYAWNRYMTAKMIIPQRRQHKVSAQRTRDAYIQQFDIGQRTLLDLLDSENELWTTRNTYSEAQRDQLLGSFEVLRHTGALLDYLGVPLPAASRIERPRFLSFS